MRSPHRVGIASLFFAIVIGLLPSAAAVAQESGMSLTVDLQEFDDSGVTGTAVLTETTEGGVLVSMTLTGETVDGNHPTHIHTGTCSNFDPNPLYPLETVNLSPVNQEGVSETTVADTDLASLQEGEYVILVHESPENLTNYLICGDISAAAVGTADMATGGDGTAVAHHMPVAGVGFGKFDDASMSSAIVILGALAALSATTGLTLRWGRK